MTDDLIKKIAEAPAVALEESMQLPKKFLFIEKPFRRVQGYWKMLGPGLTTGASDDDPSGIATYSQQGARYGYQLLWLAGFTFPLMAIVQEMCARIGLVTGRGLAGNIRMHFPRWVLYGCAFLLFFANAFNIGADLGAMAEGVQLLAPGLGFGLVVVILALLSLGLQIFSTYEKYAKYLKWLALILLSYIFSALSVHNLDWGQIAHSAVAVSMTFSKDQILIVCAILGTTISPYLFFWQTSQEVEDQIQEGMTTIELRQSETSGNEIKKMRVDVWSGMFLSNVVMFFIIVACSATLFSHGITNIATAADAAQALKPFAGDGAYFLFALGIIGTGLLAIPVLAGSASYAITESFHWKAGLNYTLKQAYAFYGVIILATLFGLGMNFVGLDPIKALIYSAVLNGLIAPVVLILIVLMSANSKIMGQWKNHSLTTVLGWMITGIMIVAGVAAIISLVTP